MRFNFLLASFLVFFALSVSAQFVSKVAVRFGLLSDIQYCDTTTLGSRFYKNSLAKTVEIVTKFNALTLDFSIHLGDIIDRDIESYDSILSIIRQLKNPVYFAYGNHDYNVSEKFISSIDSIHRQSKSYYSFSKNGWRCIVLNTNDISIYGNPVGSRMMILADSITRSLKLQGKSNGQPWNGGLGPMQMQWLQHELENATQAHQLTVVFGHHPIYPPAADNALNDSEILQLLEKFSCVKAYFCGHKHLGNFSEKNSIYFFNQKGVVETPHSNAYSIVELSSDSIHIQGFGREPNRNLPIK